MNKKKSSNTNMTPTEHKTLFKIAKIEEIKEETKNTDTPNAVKVKNQSEKSH